MSGECQVNVKFQSELDIGGRETCCFFYSTLNGTWLGQRRQGLGGLGLGIDNKIISIISKCVLPILH